MLGGGREEIPVVVIDKLDSSLFPLNCIATVSSISRDFTADFVFCRGVRFELHLIQRGFSGSQEIGAALRIGFGGFSNGDFRQHSRLFPFFGWHKPLLSLNLIWHKNYF